MKVLYIYFDAFSDTGGIQTFNRALLKAADELDEARNQVSEEHQNLGVIELANAYRDAIKKLSSNG